MNRSCRPAVDFIALLWIDSSAISSDYLRRRVELPGLSPPVAAVLNQKLVSVPDDVELADTVWFQVQFRLWKNLFQQAQDVVLRSSPSCVLLKLMSYRPEAKMLLMACTSLSMRFIVTCSKRLSYKA